MNTINTIEPRWCRWFPFPWGWFACIWAAAGFNLYSLAYYSTNWFQVTNRADPPTLIRQYGWYETDVVRTSFGLGMVLFVQCVQVFPTIYFFHKYPDMPPTGIRILYYWTTFCIIVSVILGQQYCTEMFLAAQFHGHLLQPQPALFAFWTAQTCLLISMVLMG